MKRRKVFAALKISLALLILAVVALSIFLRIEQYRFRRKAETLLSDIRGIEVGKNITNAVRVAERWSFETGQHRNGDRYHQLELMNSSGKIAQWRRWGDPYRPLILRIGAFLGARPTVVHAYFTIRRDTVLQRGIVVWLGGKDRQGKFVILGGSVDTKRDGALGEDMGPSQFRLRTVNHPGFIIMHQENRTGPDPVDSLWVNSSTAVSNEDISKVGAFTLDCITRLRPCTLADLMPSAWEQTVKDDEAPKKIECGPNSAERIAAIADSSAIYEVRTTKLEPLTAWGPWRLDGLKLRKQIATDGPEFINRETMVDTEKVPLLDNGAPIEVGHEYIFLLHTYRYRGWHGNMIFPCGILELNDSNLEIGKRVRATSSD